MKAKDLPLYYTAEELSLAVNELFKLLATDDQHKALVMGNLILAVSEGKIACLGISGKGLAFGLPEDAPWLHRGSKA